jgi:hypothetical protein
VSNSVSEWIRVRRGLCIGYTRNSGVWYYWRMGDGSVEMRLDASLQKWKPSLVATYRLAGGVTGRKL